MILSDVALCRLGLGQLLASCVGIELVNTPGGSAFDSDDSEPVDVVLVDSRTPGPTKIFCDMELSNDPRIVVFGVDEDDDGKNLALAEAGVLGFVGCSASLQDLTAAIAAAAAGEMRAPKRVADLILRRLANLSGSRVPTERDTLTRREREVAYLIDNGLSNNEIAQRLGIQLSTVKNHVHQVLVKTNARRRGEAASRLRRLQHPLAAK